MSVAFINVNICTYLFPCAHFLYSVFYTHTREWPFHHLKVEKCVSWRREWCSKYLCRFQNENRREVKESYELCDVAGKVTCSVCNTVIPLLGSQMASTCISNLMWTTLSGEIPVLKWSHLSRSKVIFLKVRQQVVALALRPETQSWLFIQRSSG